jgi:ribosomal protein L11 methyltransferase
MSYTEVKFTFEPFNSIYPELLADSLAEIGFDSFITEDETLMAYIPTKCLSIKGIKKCISSFFMPEVTIAFTTKSIEEHNWNEEWEKNEYEPIIIPGLCAIHATHHTDIPAIPYDIIINPQMAFGSGAHETTSMLTELLLNLDLNGLTALDMGCGTGILSIAMAKRGAQKVVAIDIDEKSVNNTIENCHINGTTNIEVIHGDASSIPMISPGYGIIVANIHKNIILNDLPAYASALAPQGTLVVSGFFIEDSLDIQEKAKLFNLTLTDSHSKNNWTVLKFQNK